MRIVMFYHSLVSDWNHGNAHFLRGIARELQHQGHDLTLYEPRAGWSVTNLLTECGPAALDDFRRAYPGLTSTAYTPGGLDLDAALDGADLVIVHEWNPHGLVARIGEHRLRRGRYRLLFHDTHHRCVTDPAAMAAYDLTAYDGVLAFGEAVRRRYLDQRWATAAWTWHEAADARHFRPQPEPTRYDGDLVWIGNWGDDERTAELHEFLLEPVRQLGLRAKVFGVRYPDAALRALERAGIEYGGFLPNHRVPRTLSRYRLTVHVPRRPYAAALPGIPTIRVFEALACGVPLASAPWQDTEHLFETGRDYLLAHNTHEMVETLDQLLRSPDRRAALSQNGRTTILERHTCAHRANELMSICREMGLDDQPRPRRTLPGRRVSNHA